MKKPTGRLSSLAWPLCSVAQERRLLEVLLHGRDGSRRLFHLIDANHGIGFCDSLNVGQCLIKGRHGKMTDDDMVWQGTVSGAEAGLMTVCILMASGKSAMAVCAR